MSDLHLVSIIIPTFNRAKYIEETIQSVISQTISNWELIIVDDGSTDSTLDILNKYSKKDNRIHVYRRQSKPKGANHCRNIGIEKSNGEFLIFLDSDDLLLPWCIHERIQFATKNYNNDLWIFSTLLFKITIGDSTLLWNKLFTEESDIDRFLCGDNVWATAGVLWKKDTFKKIGFWDINLLGWQDWEIHVRATLKATHCKCSSLNPDNIYRIENKGKVSSKPAIEYLSNSIDAIKKINGIVSDKKHKRKMFSIIYKKSMEALNEDNNLKIALEILKNGIQIDLVSYQLCKLHLYYRRLILTITSKKSYWYKVRLPIISKDLFDTHNQFMKYPIEEKNLNELIEKYENHK